jgi:hypothetical protein
MSAAGGQDDQRLVGEVTEGGSLLGRGRRLGVLVDRAAKRAGGGVTGAYLLPGPRRQAAPGEVGVQAAQTQSSWSKPVPRLPAVSAARTFNPRTPPATGQVVMVETPCTLRSRSPPALWGHSAGWKRMRAWSARTATRSGPSTAGRARSMLGSRWADTTGTPSVTILPQGTWAPWTATIGTTTTSGSAKTRRPGRPRSPPRPAWGRADTARATAARTGRGGGGRGTA